MDDSECFCVLGPLQVSAGGRAIFIPAGKQRALLAALLVNANEVVPVSELVDRLWGDGLPSRPRRALHTMLTRLRQSLEADGAGLGRRIRTAPGGYTIEVAPCCLDLRRFDWLTRLARAAGDRGDLAGEADLLTEALALWRGQPLADIESESLHREVAPRLREGWLTTSERYHDVCLALGRHDQIVGELRALTFKYPFHERRWTQLMTALYRCGRRGEALEAYAAMRTSFRDELGVEPGEEARRLHLAMLHADEELLPVRGPLPREQYQQRAS
ncbi:AfsR/SARP family transcriptional regulator [Streptomyces roseoverticillatus]|uniref:AfsR/SARP family transcriptional regulator n=1 Tax=Streptomyces roseoverticillatus TaxID=66429 RepID=UPI000998C43D|nr:AfsR/SARP family transcriptional regulator [Streptomyces roseoverticillatus]